MAEPNPSLAIQAFGFTQRQARFLVLVLEHSGVCLPRQYRAFAGIAHGRQTHESFDKLVRNDFATTDGTAPGGSKQAPADGSAVSSSPVLLQWDAVVGAGYYFVCLADTPITTVCPTGFRGTATPSLTWDGVAPGDHYWPFDSARSARSGPP